jgi:FMN phosphatase YigB (HAD superfamily)
MFLKSEVIRNPRAIKNIIFDFGGVICNIDFKLTEQRFIDLGLKGFDTQQGIRERDTIFGRFEEGKILPSEFRDSIRKFLIHQVSDREIDDAWNALLLDIPEARVSLLEALRKNYRIFLLSNSNEIHYIKYRQEFEDRYGYPHFDALFEKAFFSYRIMLKKPGQAIFDYVLKERGLDPSETLFIDDSIQHVEGARLAGMHALHLNLMAGEDIIDLFSQAE